MELIQEKQHQLGNLVYVDVSLSSKHKKRKKQTRTTTQTQDFDVQYSEINHNLIVRDHKHDMKTSEGITHASKLLLRINYGQ